MAKKHMNDLESIGKYIVDIIPKLDYCKTKQDVIDLVNSCILPKMNSSKIIQRDYKKFMHKLQASYGLTGAQFVVVNWSLAGEGNRIIK